MKSLPARFAPFAGFAVILALSGCAAFNKPIGPNDSWARQAEVLNAPVAND